MNGVRPIQNFNQKRALIVSVDERAALALSTTLPKLGMSVSPLVPAEFSIPALDAETDILFVDGDHVALRQFRFAEEGTNPPVPVIGLVGVEAPSRLRLLMELGATAFLPKPVHSGTVFSALCLAATQHARRTGLEAAIDDLQMRRRKRRHVIKAVTLVMRMDGLDDEAAFQQLRRKSMQARVPLETYCEYVVQRCTTQNDRETPLPGRTAFAE